MYIEFWGKKEMILGQKRINFGVVKNNVLLNITFLIYFFINKIYQHIE